MDGLPHIDEHRYLNCIEIQRNNNTTILENRSLFHNFGINLVSVQLKIAISGVSFNAFRGIRLKTVY